MVRRDYCKQLWGERLRKGLIWRKKKERGHEVKKKRWYRADIFGGGRQETKGWLPQTWEISDSVSQFTIFTADSSFRNIICHNGFVSRGVIQLVESDIVSLPGMKDVHFFATLNLWRFRVKEWWIKKTHLRFIPQDSPLRGFLLVSSLLVNFLSPLVVSLSLSLSGIHMMYNEHTYSYTSCQQSQDMLPPLLLWW